MSAVNRLRTDVSALYIDPRGPYPKLIADCWDEARDARMYAGPNPVVAHPPCGPWSALRHLYRGEGADCGPLAIEHARRFGGVVEQPAYSTLFAYCGIKQRTLVPVEQVWWGHPARKRTWLYVHGIDPVDVFRLAISAGDRTRKATHWCSGGGTGRGKTPPGIKVCSAQQRRRTPIAFAEWLIALAASARRTEAA